MARKEAALTKSGTSFPAYINLTRRENQFCITVRGEPTNGVVGPTAQIFLDAEQMGTWLKEVNRTCNSVSDT